jgi:PAS domain S-box-containing protein
MNVRQLVAPGHEAVVDECFLKPPESPDGERTCECELQHRDGRRIWTEVILGRVSDHEGRLTAIQGVARDVTERKRAAESLEASERRFRTLVEEAPVAVAISREARTIYLNHKGLKLYGFERVEDVAGRPVTDQWASEFRPIIKERAERRARGESVPSEYEGIGERKDGSHFPVHVSVASVELSDGAASLVFVTDMTERKASEERFRLLIESASDIITVVNGEGVVRFVSPSVKRSLGYEPEELLNRNMLELMTSEDAPKAAAALERALNDPAFGASVEYSFFHRDGSCRILQCIGRRLPNAPAEGAIVVNARDVTESRKLEEQYRQAQKMEAIGQLAGGVAHDFNNIIGAIMIQADLAVEEKGLSTSTREWLLEIRLAAERAGALTRQLLMFSHRQVMQPRQVSVNDLVFDLSKMLKRIIGEDIGLQLNLHGEQLHTFADPGMLDQVLMNLVVNARDAMPSGGKLFIETGERILTDEEAAGIPDASAGPYVSLRVSDTGLGIPAEVLPRIFDPFFTTKEVGKGTGLGLATVFGIVKQHRGWIRVESELGKGTRFQIYLPAVSPPAEAKLAALKPKPRGGSETILLVEDDAPVRVVTKILLEKSGYHVIEAASGADALRLWPEHRTEVDLVLTDLVMPGEIGGQDLARRLQAERGDLKIIFTSGYSADLAGRALQPADRQCFVQKPCPPDQLLETVRGCLDSN